MDASIGYGQEINYYGTEKEFWAKAIEEITALSPEITCIGSVDQYDGEPTTIPEFVFAFHGKEMLKLKRRVAINAGTGRFDTTVFVNDYNVFLNQEMIIGSDWSPTVIGARSLKISWLIAHNIIIFSMAAGIGSWGLRNLGLVSIKNGDAIYGDGWWANYDTIYPRTSIFNIYQHPSSTTPYTFRDFNSNMIGSFTSRFQYKADAGLIDYARGAIYTNNGNRVFDVSCIYDCSEVTIGDSISLSSGSYLAIGPHQLVKVLDSQSEE